MNREKETKERDRILNTISGIEAICGLNTSWQECQHCVALEMFEKSEALEEELQAEREKVAKLKRLMFLTDPAVSTVVVGGTQIKQHQEFLKCFPDERQVLEKVKNARGKNDR